MCNYYNLTKRFVKGYFVKNKKKSIIHFNINQLHSKPPGLGTAPDNAGDSFSPGKMTSSPPVTAKGLPARPALVAGAAGGDGLKGPPRAARPRLQAALRD
jgi:hypothetical protein